MSRKLAAIMSANVSNYGRLMSDDEVATVKTLISYREMIFNIIKQYNGRVVDSSGDNILSEFSSTINATEAAVDIQRTLKAHNDDLAINRRMEYSIGINIGDIVVIGDRIYGDSVNIVARLEQLTKPGEITISQCAYEQVENRLPLEFEYLGQRKVKNIEKPLYVYKLLSEPEEIQKISVLKPGCHNEGRRPLLDFFAEVFSFLNNNSRVQEHSV